MFSKIWKSIQESQQRRADWYLLTSMSDRQLRDMGLTRGELRSRFNGKQD